MPKTEGSESAVTDDRLKENPIASLDLHVLKELINELYKNRFEGKDSVTLEELQIGAKIARKYGYHQREDEETLTGEPHSEHNGNDGLDDGLDGGSDGLGGGSDGLDGSNDGLDDEGNDGLDDDNNDDELQRRRRHSTSSSLVSANGLLKPREWRAISIQQAKSFWKEPKDLLVTLLTCCVASMTQGWDQVANGNLGWPGEFGLDVSAEGTGTDLWKFGIANAIIWFSAAVLGPFLVDPICHSRFFGRRGAVFGAACFSFASVVGGSQTNSWLVFDECPCSLKLV